MRRANASWSEALGRLDDDVMGLDRRTATPLGGADWLALAAAPSFTIMALLSGFLGAGKMATICGVAPMSLSLGGMVPMYLLMSAFHSGPWLKLVAARRAGVQGSRRGGREAVCDGAPAV
jgi:hypothetical protein